MAMGYDIQVIHDMLHFPRLPGFCLLLLLVVGALQFHDLSLQ